MQKKKKNKGGLWITLGLVLIAASLLLSAYNLYDAQRAQSASVDSVQYLQAQILPKQAPEMPEAEVPAQVAPDVQEETEAPPVVWEEVEIPDYILDPTMAMPTSSYDGHDYIGILEIPKLDLVIPVMEEWSYPKLRIAPCRYAGTAYADDFVICAHNYDAHFGRLSQLEAGDAVRFTDVDGNVFEYTVALRETLHPTDIEGMGAADWDLSLFTCTRGGSYRITVRCMRNR